MKEEHKKSVGHIVQIIGTVVDVEFDSGEGRHFVRGNKSRIFWVEVVPEIDIFSRDAAFRDGVREHRLLEVGLELLEPADIPAEKELAYSAPGGVDWSDVEIFHKDTAKHLAAKPFRRHWCQKGRLLTLLPPIRRHKG